MCKRAITLFHSEYVGASSLLCPSLQRVVSQSRLSKVLGRNQGDSSNLKVKLKTSTRANINEGEKRSETLSENSRERDHNQSVLSRSTLRSCSEELAGCVMSKATVTSTMDNASRFQRRTNTNKVYYVRRLLETVW